MVSRKLMVGALALVMATAAAFSAVALPQGRQVPVDQNLIRYFAQHGVDAPYLTTAASQIPSDVLATMTAVESDQGFRDLVMSDLRTDASALGMTLYLNLGRTTYEYSRNANGTGESFSAISAS